MMRYSEIPHDFSSDSLHFAELGEDQIYRNLRDDSPPSDISIQSGPAFPLIGENSEKKYTENLVKNNLPTAPSTSSSTLSREILKSASKRNQIGSYNCNNTASPCDYGYGSMSSSKKSNSLPPNASIHDLDTFMINALRVAPEELANQITLLDFPIFSQIQPDELTSCAWTKKNKHVLTPNIVAFTKRFNHTSFWTVQEILSGPTPKYRAEILAHFIRVGKKLFDLNNLHSLFAIISAMQSASIYRLAKTWSCLAKKDKQTFDRLADIFIDKNNWSNLREYLESLKLPCIPYIGLFLTDLVYIDLAYPHTGGGLEPEQRRTRMNNILRVISSYQGSDYGHIQPVIQTQKYLQSVRYIEELQNIFEEDQYKKSLKLEPSSLVPSSSSCSSKESVTPVVCNVDSIALASLNLSPAKSVSSMRASTATGSASKFVPGHRKCRSLGTKCRSTSLPRNFHQKCICTITTTRSLPPNRCKCRIFSKTSAQLPSEHNNEPSLTHQHSRHLLDDSVLEDKLVSDAISTGSSEGVFGYEIEGDVLCQHHEILEFQGCVRRKTVLKDGRKPAVASWQRYWVQIWANSLVYFPPKSFKGNERHDFKREPCKVCSLDGWTAEHMDNLQQANTFQLINSSSSTIYKFRTSSPKLTTMWLDALHRIALQNTEKPLPINLMSFE